MAIQIEYISWTTELLTLRIQGLNIDIIYAPGKLKVIADFLSRPVCQEDCVQKLNLVSIKMPSLNAGTPN